MKIDHHLRSWEEGNNGSLKGAKSYNRWRHERTARLQSVSGRGTGSSVSRGRTSSRQGCRTGWEMVSLPRASQSKRKTKAEALALTMPLMVKTLVANSRNSPLLPYLSLLPIHKEGRLRKHYWILNSASSTKPHSFLFNSNYCHISQTNLWSNAFPASENTSRFSAVWRPKKPLGM